MPKRTKNSLARPGLKHKKSPRRVTDVNQSSTFNSSIPEETVTKLTKALEEVPRTKWTPIVDEGEKAQNGSEITHRYALRFSRLKEVSVFFFRSD